MTKAYQIKNWDDNFEVAQGRKCTVMKWCAVPNSHSGNGYLEIAEHPESVKLFCAWNLIVQVASKMKTRGLLVSDSGKPLTAKQMSRITRYPVEIFELAFEVLCSDDIGWMERKEI